MKGIPSAAGFLAVSQLASSLCLIALQSFAARSVGLEAFGEFTVAFTVASTIESVFTARGGEMALQFMGGHWVKGEYAAAKAHSERLIRSEWIFNWSLFLLLSILALPLASFFEVKPGFLVCLFLTIPAQIGYGVQKSLFVISNKIPQQAALELAFSAAQAAVGIAGTYFFGIYGLIVGMVLVVASKNFVSSRFAGRLWPRELDSRSGQPAIGAASWLQYGFHSALRNGFQNASSQLDILLVNHFLGAAPVAVYKIAKMLAALPARFSSPLWSVVRPKILVAIEYGRKKDLLKWICLPSGILAALFLLVAAPLYFLGPRMISWIYGAQYLGAFIPFMILLAGNWIFQALTGWFNFWIIITRKRMLGTLVSGFMFCSIAAGGLALGSGLSETSMAWIVTGCMVSTSLICWGILITRPLMKGSP